VAHEEPAREAIHMIRKGQACWSAAAAMAVLLHRFILSLNTAMEYDGIEWKLKQDVDFLRDA
jgi:hypothetical protein